VKDPAHWDEFRRRAEQLAAVFAGVQAVTEAELAAHGVRPVSVAHGAPGTSEDADLIYGTLHRLAGECGSLAGYRGGNEYTTFLFTGPAADGAAAAFTARALAIAPRWWRITATAYPVWPAGPGEV
jgi:hypothetical protein